MVAWVRYLADYIVEGGSVWWKEDDNDYRMFALPLDMRVGSTRTQALAGHQASENADQALKLQDFNRHYGGYYFHYKKDELVDFDPDILGEQSV